MPKKLEGHNALACPSVRASQSFYVTVQKANARLKFLYRKQNFLNLHTKKLLVMSLIQCHFDYACSFWYPG